MCINKKQIYIYKCVCVPIKNAGSQSLYTSQIIKRLLPSRSVKGTVSEVFPNVMIREVLECHWEDKVQPAEKLSRVLTLTHWYLYHSIFFQKNPTIYTISTPKIHHSKTACFACFNPPKVCLFQGGSYWFFLTSTFLEMCRHLLAAVKPAMDLCLGHSSCEFTGRVSEPKGIQPNMKKTSKHVLSYQSNCQFLRAIVFSSVYLTQKIRWKCHCCHYLLLQRHFVHVRANLALGGAFWQRLVRDVHILGLPRTRPRSRYNRVDTTGAMASLDLHKSKCLIYGWLSKCWFLDWVLIPHFHWGPLHKYLVGLPYLHFSKI